MMFWLPMCSADVAGTASSPICSPLSDSICFTVARSAWATPKSFFACDVTNFTARSGPRTIEATPAAMSTFATLVIAGEADSNGKGTTGAFGKGSGAMAVAVAAEERPSPRAAGRGGSDAVTGGTGVVPLSVFVFGLRGLSHRSQRIPSEIAAPHMKHLEAIRGSPILAQLTVDS